MVGTSKKEAKNPVVNPAFCKLIYALNVSHDNSIGLSKRLNKTQGIIYRQLQDLLQLKYVKPSNAKKNAYQVNYPRITEAFLDFLVEEIDRLHSMEIDKIMGGFLLGFRKELVDEKFRKELLGNPFLNLFFESLFETVVPDASKDYLIIKIFTDVVDSNGLLIVWEDIHKHHKNELKRKNKKDETIISKHFLRFNVVAFAVTNLRQRMFETVYPMLSDRILRGI